MIGARDVFQGAAILGAVVASAVGQVSDLYSYQILDAPVGMEVTAGGITDDGVVVGSVVNIIVGEPKPRVWVDGVGTELPMLDSHFIGHARAMNEHGLAVGYTRDPNDETVGSSPVRWEGGSVFGLGLLGGDSLPDYGGADVNSSGLVVGTSGGDGFVWSAGGGFARLSDVAGERLYPIAVNDSGVIIGTDITGGNVPFRWANGVKEHVPLPPNTLSASVADINSAGDIVGGVTVGTPGSSTGGSVIWSDSGMTFLPSLGAPGTFVGGINDSGLVVGTSRYLQSQFSPFHATVWFDGVAYDLNDRLDGAVGFELRYAVLVNNSGLIVANGEYVPSGNAVTVVLTPVLCDGDANGDSVVDVNDVSYVLFRLGGAGDGDANGDGVVDVNDISYVLFRLGDPCP